MEASRQEVSGCIHVTRPPLPRNVWRDSRPAPRRDSRGQRRKWSQSIDFMRVTKGFRVPRWTGFRRPTVIRRPRPNVIRPRRTGILPRSACKRQVTVPTATATATVTNKQTGTRPYRTSAVWIGMDPSLLVLLLLRIGITRWTNTRQTIALPIPTVTHPSTVWTRTHDIPTRTGSPIRIVQTSTNSNSALWHSRTRRFRITRTGTRVAIIRNGFKPVRNTNKNGSIVNDTRPYRVRKDSQRRLMTEPSLPKNEYSFHKYRTYHHLHRRQLAIDSYHPHHCLLRIHPVLIATHQIHSHPLRRQHQPNVSFHHRHYLRHQRRSSRPSRTGSQTNDTQTGTPCPRILTSIPATIGITSTMPQSRAIRIGIRVTLPATDIPRLHSTITRLTDMVLGNDICHRQPIHL